MQKNKLSNSEKVCLAVENGEPTYDSMHQEDELPYSKADLILWHAKNYVKGFFSNILTYVIWIVSSLAATTLISYLYMCKLEPWLEKKSWKYLNLSRDKLIYIYPYIFGSDGNAKLLDKFGNEYMKGFDEPWQFIYRRYDHWYDTGTYGGATEEWVAVGFFSIFFTFALISLIGLVVAKLKNHGVKAFFSDLFLIPKKVSEYGKRSQKKIFDHLLLGCFVAFVSGFFIKNPFAMPLIAIGILISFTMGANSKKAYNHFARECAINLKDDEEKPLFADSALHLWGLGSGFLIYSFVGFSVWKNKNFSFKGRLISTLIWLAVITFLYVYRNGKKSVKLISQACFAVFITVTVGTLYSVASYAKILRKFFDKDGNFIGQEIQFTNDISATPESSFGTAFRNGAGGGLGGANLQTEMKKQRKAARDKAREEGIPQMEEYSQENWDDLNYFEKYRRANSLSNALEASAKGNGDMSAEGLTSNSYLQKLQKELADFKNRMNTGKLSGSDLSEYNSLVDRVNKYIRGDTDVSGVENWNANPETSQQTNDRIEKESYARAGYETAKEVAEGKTPAAQAVRIGAATLTEGGSEVVIHSMGSGINMYEGVQSGKYDTPAQAFVGEATSTVVDNAIDSITPKVKIKNKSTDAGKKVVQNLTERTTNSLIGSLSGQAQGQVTGGQSLGSTVSDAASKQMKK